MRLFPLLILCTACSPFTQAQSQLTGQVRQGMELCRQAQQQRAALVEQYHQLQSQRLDDAFDADVRQRPALSADWVIEHRKAYRVAADAVASQHQASQSADRVANDNFQAIDIALQRLLYLQDLQARLTTIDGLLTALPKAAK